MRKIVCFVQLAVLLISVWACSAGANTVANVPAKTEQQVQTEMLAHFSGNLLQPQHRWMNDGIWIKRNTMMTGRAKQNKLETEWTLKNGKKSKVFFKSGDTRIGRHEGDTDYYPGRIEANFDFWNLYIGGTLIGQVYFDGRMLDGRGHPCGKIDGPVDDDMAVYIYFVYAIGEY